MRKEGNGGNRTAATVAAGLCILLGSLILAGIRDASGQVADEHGLGADMMRLRQIEGAAGFDYSRLSGAERNLFSLADRWALIANRIPQGSPRTFDAVRRLGSATNLRASRYSGFTQSETSTAWCGPNAVIGFNDTGAEITTITGGRGVSMVGYALSGDAGATFAYMGSPTTAANPNTFMAGDPVMACADWKTFYLLSAWFDGTNEVSGVSLSKSFDGGRTFETPMLVAGKPSATHIIGKGWIAVDPNLPSRIYVVYTDLDFSGSVCGTSSGSAIPRYAIEAVSSPDAGLTWSAPVVVSQVCADAAHTFAFVNGAQTAVGPSGEIYVAWEEFGGSGSISSRAIEIAKSVDAGSSFSAPLTVATPYCAGDCADWQGLFHSNEYPTLATGRGPHRGIVYLAWNDGNRQIPDMLTTTGFYNFTDIMFSRSADGGATWSTPVRVNDNPKGGGTPLSDQFEPAMATDDTGRIAICFYDRRNDPSNFRIDRYCASSPGGLRWTNTRITFQNFPSVVGEDVLVAPDYMGDYDSLASDFRNHHSGFIDSFANNLSGNPTVATNSY
jgi:hypothetical protein